MCTQGNECIVLRHGHRLVYSDNTMFQAVCNSLALTMEPSAPSPEYQDAVDVLKEQERQIRELQDEIKRKKNWT